MSQRYDPPMLPGHNEAGLVVRRTNLMLTIDDQVVFADCGAAFGSRPGQPSESHRYVLWRMWGPELPLVVIGLNPSIADEFMGDHTVSKCLHFARREQLGGLTMLNLFSFRTPYPAEISRLAKAGDPDWPDAVTGGELHDRILRWHTRPEHAGRVLYGWGADGDAWGLGRATAIQRQLADDGVQPWCLDLTKSGQPKHPLYIRNDAPFRPYGRAA